MEDYQISDKECSKQVSDIHLQKLTRTHITKWRLLPPILGLEEAMKDDIDHESGDEGEKQYKFFTGWKEMQGADATYKALINALLKIGCRSDAEYVCQLMQPLPPKYLASTGDSDPRAGTVV